VVEPPALAASDTGVPASAPVLPEPPTPVSAAASGAWVTAGVLAPVAVDCAGAAAAVLDALDGPDAFAVLAVSAPRSLSPPITSTGALNSEAHVCTLI
jgi:hypothetical protein